MVTRYKLNKDPSIDPNLHQKVKQMKASRQNSAYLINTQILEPKVHKSALQIPH